MTPDDPKHDQSTVSEAAGGVTVPLTARVELAPGTRVGHFRVEKRLGEGGLGIVYRAYDEKLQRPVALKVLRRSPSGGTALLEEARAAAGLTDPHIAAVYEVTEQLGVVFIVMELVPGTTLRDEIKRGPIDAGTVTRYARHLAAGLARAHASGIVHRDLKPENVMITPEGAAKLLDFGLARDAADVQPPGHDVGTTGVAGTPAYMAPEQTRGVRVDARADVFSLGVVLYEMLAGTRPFVRPKAGDAPAPSDAWRLAAPLRTAARGVPPELARIVERCLAIDRDSRFANGSEVLGALRSLDVPVDSLGEPAGAAPKTRARAGTIRAVAGAALFVIAGGVMVLLATRGGAGAAPAGGAAPPSSETPRTSALRRGLAQARVAWQAGDARARGMLEQTVREVEHAGARAGTPDALIAADAVFLLADLDERTVEAPALREPTRDVDVGPSVVSAAQADTYRVISRYGQLSLWGPPLSYLVCASYRSGRAWEHLAAISTAAEAWENAPARWEVVERLRAGGHAELARMWSLNVGAHLSGALQCYEAALVTARYTEGAVLDPADGSDCRALALARRDALATDAGR